MERRQSSLVIVLKIASRFGPREEAALDAGELAGKVVLHGSAMPRTSGSPAPLATGFCPQVIRSDRTPEFESGTQEIRKNSSPCFPAIILGPFLIS
jgi:hypothetical protein